MKLRIPLRFTFLFLILFSPHLLQGGVRPPEIKLAGRTISMELIKAEGLSHAKWSRRVVTLTTQKVDTKTDYTMFRLLEMNGIYPDTEAYTLVYDLNPGLEKIDPLAQNITLTLPKVSGDARFRQKLKQGYLVRLTVDAKIKSRLRISATAIKELSVRFANLNASRFGDPAKREETIDFVKELSGWFDLINTTIAQRRAKPLRKVTLLQIVDEAEVLKSILSYALSSDKRLKDVDQAQISAIHRDLGEVMEIWDQTMSGDLPSGEPQFNVVVELKGDDIDKIKNLRVYYVVSGLFRNPPVRSTNFNGLGSGSSATLPIKKYKVWAAKDGDPEHPVTPITDLYVRKPLSGDTIKLELSLGQ